MYDTLKMEHLFDNILQNHPYLDLYYIEDLLSVVSNNVEITSTVWLMKNVMTTMSTSTFIVKHFSFNDIIKSMTWIKFLRQPPRNNKSFFIKYLANYLTNQIKKVLISTSVMASWLSPTIKTVHAQYLYMDIYILCSNLIIHYRS